MPTIVDSTHCHLWTDALHVRQLARDAKNRWDRGTYVRLCVNTCWTVVEVSCQEALNSSDIGHRFKDNLDRALEAAGLPPVDWSTGVWQRVRQLQERRKSYVHKFSSLNGMFPSTTTAEEAVGTAREAVQAIYAHATLTPPEWILLDEVRGWQASSNFGTAWGTACHAGTKIDDPNTVRVCVVVSNEERLVTVFPPGTDASAEVDRILRTIVVPINGIRVYECGELRQDLIVNMRGNA